MVRDRIVDVLVELGGYKSMPGPLRVVDTDFDRDFDAVLVGPGAQGCLILVIDAEKLPPNVVQRRVRSFAMVLDRSGSRRPLTVVLIARKPEEYDALELLCRVIVITPDEDVTQALRGLLPLRLPTHRGTLNVAQNTLKMQLGDVRSYKLTAALLKAAEKGADEVEREILSTILDILQAQSGHGETK